MKYILVKADQPDRNGIVFTKESLKNIALESRDDTIFLQDKIDDKKVLLDDNIIAECKLEWNEEANALTIELRVLLQEHVFNVFWTKLQSNELAIGCTWEGNMEQEGSVSVIRNAKLIKTGLIPGADYPWAPIKREEQSHGT